VHSVLETFVTMHYINLHLLLPLPLPLITGTIANVLCALCVVTKTTDALGLFIVSIVL